MSSAKLGLHLYIWYMVLKPMQTHKPSRQSRSIRNPLGLPQLSQIPSLSSHHCLYSGLCFQNAFSYKKFLDKNKLFIYVFSPKNFEEKQLNPSHKRAMPLVTLQSQFSPQKLLPNHSYSLSFTSAFLFSLYSEIQILSVSTYSNLKMAPTWDIFAEVRSVFQSVHLERNIAHIILMIMMIAIMIILIEAFFIVIYQALFQHIVT